MKVCVTSTGEGLDSAIDPRFGRCQYFVMIDTESMEFKSIQNPNVGALGGAGISSAELVSKEGAQVVITGAVGPNANRALSSFGIKIYTGASGTVKEAVQDYKEGKLKEIKGPSVPGHFGKGGK